MNEMDRKIVLVTGATGGMGKVVALELAKKGATVLIVGRNSAKTQATVKEIAEQSGNSAGDGLVADLSSMGDVRRLANEIRKRYSRLDVLINNAGAIFAQRQSTVDGYERTFALNHLAYFLLTNLLLDILKASTPSRIVNVSSRSHEGGTIHFDDLQDTLLRLRRSKGSPASIGRSAGPSDRPRLPTTSLPRSTSGT